MRSSCGLLGKLVCFAGVNRYTVRLGSHLSILEMPACLPIGRVFVLFSFLFIYLFSPSKTRFRHLHRRRILLQVPAGGAAAGPAGEARSGLQ